MWERFSSYGMQALLMLYMTKHLLRSEHAQGVLGLAGFRAALAAMFGPITDLAFAAQAYGLYSGLLYVAPLAGAWLGDRVLGKTATVSIEAKDGAVQAGEIRRRCAVLRVTGDTHSLEPAALYRYCEWLSASGEEMRDFPIYCQRVFCDAPAQGTAAELSCR